MAVRNRKRCGNCPEPVAVKPINIKPQIERPPLPKVVQAVYQVPMDEGLRLWKHVCFGTSTCIQMIEGYALMQMPGDPTEALRQMRDRLTKVIDALESKDAPDASQERSAQPSSPDSPAPELGRLDDDGGRQPQDGGDHTA